jgi:RIO kinase 1
VRDHDKVRAGRRGRRRFDDDDPYFLKRQGPPAANPSDEDGPPVGDRWTTWDDADVRHGPRPHPDWVVTELAAVDTELGILKSGKEADVHLVERAVPESGRSCVLAAKRYRGSDHRLFHRDAGYLEGRRERESRVGRAMATRTAFGRQAIAGRWAAAEFAALCRLWQLGRELGGVRVPYPVQLDGTELLLEYLSEPDGTASPRLAQVRPSAAELADLWGQLVDALVVLARAGLAHGDLSQFNILVHRGRLVLIDLPQVVDIVSNPQGLHFLARDVRVVATWFTGRGLAPALADAQALFELLRADAGLG